MTILRPADTTQTVTIIPRYNATDLTVTLLNEETQVNNEFTEVDTTYANGYLTFSFNLTCKEAESFNLEVKDGDIVLFRGKAFATDTVDLENYKLSNGSIL